MNYERKPIILDRDTVALLHIFERINKEDDITFDWTWDLTNSDEFRIAEFDQIFKHSAKEFMSILGENSCLAFKEALLLELYKSIKGELKAFNDKGLKEFINEYKVKLNVDKDAESGENKDFDYDDKLGCYFKIDSNGQRVNYCKSCMTELDPMKDGESGQIIQGLFKCPKSGCSIIYVHPLSKSVDSYGKLE